jgi:thiamine-monophosphate kinase
MSETEIPLGPGREFDRIRAIAGRLGAAAPHLGDDCAVLPEGEGSAVVSTDLSVEGVHFRRDWLTQEEIGYRAATAALSDLAAAGASCIGLLAAVSSPHDSPASELVALMGGVGDAVAAVGGSVLGGDLTAGPQWIVSITVIGRARRPMSRHGAAPGDGLWVTGVLGGARSALVMWQAAGTPDAGSRAAFARPAARISAGQWLAAHGARAMMDVSDGIAGDVGHLAAASGVAMEVRLESLPRHPSVETAAKLAGIAPEVLAAEGGEDYEILVALPPSFTDTDAAACLKDCGVPLTRIGDARAGEGLRLLLHGDLIVLHGYDHFA